MIYGVVGVSVINEVLLQVGAKELGLGAVLGIVAGIEVRNPYPVGRLANGVACCFEFGMLVIPEPKEAVAHGQSPVRSSRCRAVTCQPHRMLHIRTKDPLLLQIRLGKLHGRSTGKTHAALQ